jgi:hypothetical protein
LDGPEISRLRGCIFAMDTLFNSNFGMDGSVEKRVIHVFRATASGRPVSIRLYHQDGAGYSGGDGGDVVIRIARISTRRPVVGATELAKATWTPPMSGGKFANKADIFTTHKLTSTDALVKGEMYQIEYLSTDMTPGNFTNVDDSGPHSIDGLQWTDYEEFAVWDARRSGTGWTLTNATARNDYYRRLPNFDMLLDNGQRIGNMGFAAASGGGILTTAAPFRTRLRLDKPWNVVGIDLRCEFVRATQINVAITAGGQAIASTRMPQKSGKWHRAESVSAVIPAGESYITYTPVGGSVRLKDQQDGRTYGFSSLMGDTHRFQAQWWNGSKWLGRSMYSPSSSAEYSHWQDVLHLA